MKQRILLQKLKAAGYKVERTDGRHIVLCKDDAREVQVPKHREVAEGTASSILKDAGLK